ncbi:baculovirus repeated ORF [Adoxophyes honmai nucleopolyhedrovirus]|uniref:Baculovirus repeated ORF n=1 Tax=Adoxophyes honmai nucleopolyhedrovirus TaxID=224399 RepID=Q80LR2_NPVAH|nr:baculovirus repeated ORF [Adoxophyes honmai nucleopolyhedrovirus]BAC67285.1 baculovirus repeated ORF [Adoxophyes honmai nucleopolyhedrovirus]
MAKDVAAALKYVDCKQAIRINVDEKYKCKFNRGCTTHTPASNSVAKRGDPLYLQSNTVFIKILFICFIYTNPVGVRKTETQRANVYSSCKNISNRCSGNRKFEGNAHMSFICL